MNAPMPPATVRQAGAPSLLNRRSAAIYLVCHGLIDRRQLVAGELTVSELPGRNRVFRADSDGVPKFVIKQIGEPFPDRIRSLDREHECLRRFAEDSVIQACVPRPIRFDLQHGILVMEFVSATPLQRHLKQDAEGIESCSRNIGRSLAQLHNAIQNPNDSLASQLPRMLPWALRDKGLLDSFLYRRSRGQTALYVEISRQQDVSNGIRTVRELWQANCVINGDMKFSNCLWKNNNDNGSPLFIDWEHATWGDPAWDLAGIIQSYVVHFAIPTPAAVPQTLLEMSEHAGTQWPEMTKATSAFCSGYTDASTTAAENETSFLNRTLRYTGARLIQTATESLKDRSDVTAESLLLLQTGLNLLKHPENHTQLISARAAD